MESHLDCLSGKKERVGFNLLVWCVCVCACVCYHPYRSKSHCQIAQRGRPILVRVILVISIDQCGGWTVILIQHLHTLGNSIYHIV